MHRKTFLIGILLFAIVLCLTLIGFFALNRQQPGGIDSHIEAGNAKSLQAFQGQWTAYDGRTLFEITGDRITYSVLKGPGIPGRFWIIDCIDLNQDPPWIDWTAFDAADGRKIASQRGVYQIEDDLFIVNMSLPGEDRPSNVRNEPGAYGTYVLKRK